MVTHVDYRMNPCSCTLLMNDRKMTQEVICAYDDYLKSCQEAARVLTEKLDVIFKDLDEKHESKV
jgi:hypothetical protein